MSKQHDALTAIRLSSENLKALKRIQEKLIVPVTIPALANRAIELGAPVIEGGIPTATTATKPK